MVSWRSSACAMATLVPTPSVEAANTGCFRCVSALASNRPAKPPIPPITSGRRVLATHSFISSTALSPASISTPASAYADLSEYSGAIAMLDSDKSAELGTSEGIDSADSRRYGLQVCGVLEDGLPQSLTERQLDRIDAVEAGTAERLLADLSGRNQTVERDIPQ